MPSGNAADPPHGVDEPFTSSRIVFLGLSTEVRSHEEVKGCAGFLVRVWGSFPARH